MSSKKPATVDQLALFDNWWREHWVGMPEYEHEEERAWHCVTVHFDSEESLRRFADLLGQAMTSRTRSIWYPEAEVGRYRDTRYADEP